MEIKEQSGLRAVLADVELPRMAMIRQKFPRDGIEDVAAYLILINYTSNKPFEQ